MTPKMNDKEQVVLVAAQELDTAHITFAFVLTNFEPHPYCITPKHISGGSIYLTEDVIREAEECHGARCGTEGCKLLYDDHKSYYVACINIAPTATQEEWSNFTVAFKEFCKRTDFGLMVEGLGFDSQSAVDVLKKIGVIKS